MTKEKNTNSNTSVLSSEQWAHISWVMLDMDGTLLDLCFDDTLWRKQLPLAYAQHHKVSMQEAQAKILELANQAEGHLEWYCLDAWSEKVGFDVRPANEQLAHLIGFRKGALAFLKWLKHQNKHVILATNAHPDSISLKDMQTDLKQWVDLVMDAHNANSPKENPEYWRWLQQKTKYINHQTLFIDDNDHILDAAAQAGIRYCVGVKTPNSQQPAKTSKYPAFDHFQELYLPSL